MVLSQVPHRCLTIGQKLRAPMIKFRYGPGRDAKGNVQGGSQTASRASQSSNASQTGGIMYDFQLPLRYRRKPMGEDEIAFINSGGAV